MLVVVSPAKKLDMTPHHLPEGYDVSQPDFADDAHYLADVAGRFDTSALMSLMGISEKLALLNHDRFQAFGSQETKPAAFAFAGDTYLGLEAKSLEPHHIGWAQDHLRILSGLYGILRPLDVIEPYRLEMGSKLATDKGASLYAYWGRRIADENRKPADGRVYRWGSPCGCGVFSFIRHAIRSCDFQCCFNRRDDNTCY